MKLIVNGTAYPCKGRPSLRDPVRFSLPDGQPDPAALGTIISLQDNSGFELATVTVADFARAYIDRTSLVLTNTSEPEVTEPVETPDNALTQADIAEALLDLDYRTSLLEMGVN